MEAQTEEAKVVQGYVNQIVELSKPGTNYKLMKPNIEKAHASLEKFELLPTAKKDREKRLNQVAAAYLGGAFGIGYDGPEVAGGQLKQYINRLPDGAETLGRIYGAIERTDKVGLEAELKRALESVGGNKLEALATEVRDQPDNIKLGVYGGIGSLVADINGYEGSTVGVAENFTGAISGLQQRLATAEALGKPKPKG